MDLSLTRLIIAMGFTFLGVALYMWAGPDMYMKMAGIVINYIGWSVIIWLIQKDGK